MKRVVARARRRWPVLGATVVVFAVIATQPRLLICPDNTIGFGGLGGQGLCLPTLAPTVTGADPVAVLASWVVVGALVAAVLWLLVRFIQRRGDI